jgi:Fe2+ or Zn2+ uptake regulation protein
MNGFAEAMKEDFISAVRADNFENARVRLSVFAGAVANEGNSRTVYAIVDEILRAQQMTDLETLYGALNRFLYQD